MEIRNGGSTAGTISRFDLKLTGDVIGPGVGEVISDQVSAGFRIHVSGGGTAVGRSNWTPVGPAGHGAVNLNDDTVGRVGAIAVDTTDPSGNTVFAAGASGGLWRTTNFLTRDLIGPTWVPLGDDPRAFDWHGLERHAQHTWRWSGPNPRPRLLIPFTCDGVVRVSLHIVTAATDDVRDSLEVLVDRRSAPTVVRTEPDSARVIIEIESVLRRDRPSVVELRMSAAVP